MYTSRIDLPGTFSEKQIAIFSDALGEEAQAHSACKKGEDWILEWITADRPSAQDLTARLVLLASLQGLPDLKIVPADWTIEKIPEDTDWLALSYQTFPPFSVGPFFIYGSHYEGTVPDGQIGLQIDAATAFGSGEHETTKGCLEAMLDLKGAGICPWNVLDMGTGSGILAIAAWKLWKTLVTAIDIDKESVRVAEHHAALNRVLLDKTALLCEAGDGFAAELAQKRKPYELIVANILAGPLKEMAKDLAGVLDDNGYTILSGILNEQADGVAAVYETQGLTLKRRTEIGEWSTLLLHKPAA